MFSPTLSGSSLGHTLGFCHNLVKYRFQKYVPEGSSHLVFYDDLVSKKKGGGGQRRSEFHRAGHENSKTIKIIDVESMTQ